MKILCNACEAAEAKVLCCADEAALCLACDEKVHAANKLASKHQRVPLTGSSSQVPKCDICQEATGYFFCLEDRALLCRKCDIVVHSVNSYVSAHQRFLLTGVKVGTELSEQGVSYAREQTCPQGRSTESPSTSLLERSISVSRSGETNQVVSSHASKNDTLPASRVSFSCGSMTGIISDWPLDDIFELQDFNQNYGFMDHGYSKADSGKLGSSVGSPIYSCSFTDDEMNVECLGFVPERPWTVPEMPSPPTASGLHWPMHSSINKNSLFVPDICSSNQPRSTSAKRRRVC